MSCVALQRAVFVSRLKVACPCVSLVMCYSRGHLRSTKEYKDFRKGLRSLRIELFKEHRHKLDMMNVNYGGQATEEARKEKEREDRALEVNEEELQRMAAIRYVPYPICNIISYLFFTSINKEKGDEIKFLTKDVTEKNRNESHFLLEYPLEKCSSLILKLDPL